MRSEKVSNLFSLVGEMEGIAFIRMCLELWNDQKWDCSQEGIHVEARVLGKTMKPEMMLILVRAPSKMSIKICWGRLRGGVHTVEEEITDFQGVKCGRWCCESPWYWRWLWCPLELSTGSRGAGLWMWDVTLLRLSHGLFVDFPGEEVLGEHWGFVVGMDFFVSQTALIAGSWWEAEFVVTQNCCENWRQWEFRFWTSGHSEGSMRGAPYSIIYITIIYYCQIILVIISYSCSICFSSEHSDSYLKSLPEMLNDAGQLCLLRLLFSAS